MNPLRPSPTQQRKHRQMISNNITIESTLEWAKSLSDEQLFLLIEDLNTISDERRKIISRHNKQCLSYSNKRNFCCPKCGFPVVKNGKRKDGAQIYRCKNPYMRGINELSPFYSEVTYKNLNHFFHSDNIWKDQADNHSDSSRLSCMGGCLDSRYNR